MIGGNPCVPNPCGTSTQCYVTSGRPVCSCLPGHWGNPLTYCQRGECQGIRDIINCIKESKQTLQFLRSNQRHSQYFEHLLHLVLASNIVMASILVLIEFLLSHKQSMIVTIIGSKK